MTSITKSKLIDVDDLDQFRLNIIYKAYYGTINREKLNHLYLFQSKSFSISLESAWSCYFTDLRFFLNYRFVSINHSRFFTGLTKKDFDTSTELFGDCFYSGVSIPKDHKIRFIRFWPVTFDLYKITADVCKKENNRL